MLLDEGVRVGTKFLRGLNSFYRRALGELGDIDKALRRTLNTYRKTGCWIPKDEWNIISSALRSGRSRKFEPAKVAAEISGLDVSSEFRASVVSQLKNRRLLAPKKARRK